jgi:hypothetical protein
MPGTPPAVAALVGRYAAALGDAGFAAEDALLALDFVVDLTVSTAVMMGDLDRVHQTPDGPRTLRELHQRGLDQLAALAPGAAGEMWTGRGWFDRKLAVLLDGLSHRLPPPVENERVVIDKP